MAIRFSKLFLVFVLLLAASGLAQSLTAEGAQSCRVSLEASAALSVDTAPEVLGADLFAPEAIDLAAVSCPPICTNADCSCFYRCSRTGGRCLCSPFVVCV